MLLLLFLLLTALVMAGYLHLFVDLNISKETTWQINTSFHGFKKVYTFRLVRTQQGLNIQYLPRKGMPRTIDRSKLRSPRHQLIRSGLHSKKVKRYFLKHIRGFYLSSDAVIHTNDAAATAMITGCFQAAGTILQEYSKQISLTCTPGFTHQHTSVHIRCMFSLRMGTLLITSFLMLLPVLQQLWNENRR